MLIFRSITKGRLDWEKREERFACWKRFTFSLLVVSFLLF